MQTPEMTEAQKSSLEAFPRVTDWLLRSDGMLIVHVPHGKIQVTFLVRPDGKYFRSDA